MDEATLATPVFTSRGVTAPTAEPTTLPNTSTTAAPTAPPTKRRPVCICVGMALKLVPAFRDRIQLSRAVDARLERSDPILLNNPVFFVLDCVDSWFGNGSNGILYLFV